MNKVRSGRIHGFTLVELIVVIAIIGILAAITIVGLTRYQADTRDARRESSATVIAEALEKYYDNNGEYPSCSAISAAGATVTSTTLKGMDQTSLLVPTAPASETNSIKCNSAGSVLTISGADFYEYVGDNSAACNTNVSCLSFKLKYKAESGPEIKTITSRRTTDIATSGNITNLTASSSSFTTYTLNWGSIANASAYSVQASSDNGFVNNLIETSSATNAATLTGYTAGTTRYFRVKPVTNDGISGSWSNVAAATTRQLNTPTLTAAVNNPNQVTTAWSGITYAENYRIQRSTSASFPAGASTQEISQAVGAGTSKVYTDEQPGVTKYYRVQAYATGDTSDWSNVVARTTAGPPAGFYLSQEDPQYNIVRSTSNAICAPGTTPYYYWYYAGAPWVEGTGYRVVDGGFPSWNYTVNINNSTRCQTNDYASDFTSAYNNSSRTLSLPYTYIGNDAYRQMSWGGSCPQYTTSWQFNWSIAAEFSVSGVTYNAGGTYSNQGQAWGDGRGRVTLHCYSPAPFGWGDVTAYGEGGFGPKCLPMTAACPR